MVYNVKIEKTVMEWKIITNCENDGTLSSYVTKRKKLNCLGTVYAGLIAFLVPSVLCVSDWTAPLTYDQIFNSTDYAQIQHTPRPYSVPYTQVEDSIKANKYKEIYNVEEDTKGNELEYGEYSFNDVSDKEQLLVGFSHDPFRYSVPKEDYLKGVRSMNPQMYMSRGKRGVLHLYNMMYCATGCEPLSYKGYGCYCGFLGSGRPTDGIDRCCKMHDECYENIYCPFFTVYFQPYYWKCYKGEPLCAVENYKTQHQFINGCAARLCECDRQFAMCVKRYRCPRRRALCHSSPLRLLQNLLMLPYR